MYKGKSSFHCLGLEFDIKAVQFTDQITIIEVA